MPSPLSSLVVRPAAAPVPPERPWPGRTHAPTAPLTVGSSPTPPCREVRPGLAGAGRVREERPTWGEPRDPAAPPRVPPNPEAIDRALEDATQNLVEALVRHVRRQLPIDVEGAHDAVQETFLTAWLQRDRFRDTDHVRPWLYRVAYRKGIDWLRRRRTTVCDGELAGEVSKSRTVLPHSPKATPLDAWLGPAHLGPAHPTSLRRSPGPDAYCQVLRRCLARLRPIHSEVVRLHYVLGYDTAKTAALLGHPRSAIKMRLHRARAALRTFAAEEVQALPPRRATLPTRPRPRRWWLRAVPGGHLAR